jgi:hypothetical protein
MVGLELTPLRFDNPRCYWRSGSIVCGDEGKAVGSEYPGGFAVWLIGGVGVPCNLRSHFMRSYRNEFADSKTAQKKIAETEKRIDDATRQARVEFASTFEEMSRAVMSRATAEIELGVRFTQKLGAARSLPDVMSAYQEWLSEEMNARSEDARQFMTNSQKFITAGTRFFSNGGARALS